jgi:Ca2+-binding RTX toxin-like protein
MSDFAADGLLTYDGAIQKLREFSENIRDPFSDYVTARTTEDLIGELKAIVTGTSGLLVEDAGPDVTYLLWTGEDASGLVDEIKGTQAGQYVREVDCHVGQLVDSQEFKDVLRKLIAAKEESDGIDEKMNLYLNGGLPDGSRTPEGIKNSFFNIVSEKFVSQAEGDFRIVVGVDVDVAKLDNTFLWQTELPALSEKTGSFTVDGVPIEQLKGNFDNLDAFKSATYLRADLIDKLAASDLDNWIALGTEEKVIERIQYIDGLPKGHPEKDIFVHHTHSVEHFAEFHPHLPSSFGKMLNKLGPVGTVIGLLVVSTQAGAAALSGNHDEAWEIVEDWAVDASGSWAGETVGALAGTLAVAVATGAGAAVAAPVAGAIILGASLLGGIFAAEGAAAAWNIWKHHDDASRLSLMQKYTELFFGTGTLLSQLPDILAAQGERELILPALSEPDLAAHAREDVAWRYALKELNPFVIPGIDYSAFNANGELDLYDRETNPRGMTPEYIEMRAKMLWWRLQYDQNGQDLNEDFDTDIPGNWDFIDKRLKNFEGAPDLFLEIDGAYLTAYDHQVVFGSDQGEEIEGSGDTDWLFGGAGNDTLTGKGGRDYLEGGVGNDTYIEASDGVADTILDADGQGSIRLDGAILAGGTATAYGANAEPVSWKSNVHAGLAYRRDGADLLVIKDGTVELIIRDFDFSNGDLGITLEMEEAPDDETPMNTLPTNLYHNVTLSPSARAVTTGSHADEVWGSGMNDAIALGAGSDYCSAAGGNDVILGEAGKDYLSAGPFPGNFDDDDLAVGGADRDVIRGGGGNDILHGGAIGEHLLTETADSAAFGDWLHGNEGDDELYGSRNSDILQGGAGSDLILGGAGGDLILGDGALWQVVRFSAIGSASNIVEWADGDGDGVLNGRANGYLSMVQAGALTDWRIDYTAGREDFSVTLGSGQSWSGGEPQRVVVEAEAGGDILHGGAGNDWIAGQYGNDVLYGGDGDDVLYGDDVGSAYAGDDLLYAGAGADILYGGDGDDHLYAIDDDGAEDVLYGGEGHDTLFGATGHDQLFGEGGNDRLYAGVDGSMLAGGAGQDMLWGEAGNDTLDGGADSDVFHGSAGNDVLTGGAGADSYHFWSALLHSAGNVSRLTDAAAEDRVWFDNEALASLMLIQTADNTWQSDDGHVRFTLTGGSLTIQAIQGGAPSAGRIVVERFSNGILGLTLPSAEPEAPPRSPAPTRRTCSWAARTTTGSWAARATTPCAAGMATTSLTAGTTSTASTPASATISCSAARAATGSTASGATIRYAAEKGTTFFTTRRATRPMSSRGATAPTRSSTARATIP